MYVHRVLSTGEKLRTVQPESKSLSTDIIDARTPTEDNKNESYCQQ